MAQSTTTATTASSCCRLPGVRLHTGACVPAAGAAFATGGPCARLHAPSGQVSTGLHEACCQEFAGEPGSDAGQLTRQGPRALASSGSRSGSLQAAHAPAAQQGQAPAWVQATETLLTHRRCADGHVRKSG